MWRSLKFELFRVKLNPIEDHALEVVNLFAKGCVLVYPPQLLWQNVNLESEDSTQTFLSDLAKPHLCPICSETL